jgi:hypothetical protein
MLKNNKLLMLVAIALLVLAFIYCATPEYIVQREHEFQPGLVDWQYSYDNALKQEAKFKYNSEGDISSIELYALGKPYGIWSYLNYITVKDDETGYEVKYRVCSRRVHYNENTRKIDWQDSTIAVVINNKVLIQTLTRMDGKGKNTFIDRYEYDDLGRKTRMSHSVYSNAGTTVTMEEFTYQDEKNLGVITEPYYFTIPYVYYNLTDNISWCTVAKETQRLK